MLIKGLFLFLLLSLFIISFQNVCKGNQFTGDISEAAASDFMKGTNLKRTNVANGKQTGTLEKKSMPSASNMQMLNWNTNLAKLAQNWANSLVTACNGIGHNPTRSVDGFPSVGKNIYWSASSAAILSSASS